jgi:glycosyltransferase involved in cell wall biosynthesis
MQKEKIKVLLCSPITKIGGITSWTKCVLNFYNKNKNDVNVDLHHFYCLGGKQIYATTPLYIRCIEGIKNYYCLYKGFCKITNEQKFDVVHFATSASISLTKDIILLKTAQQQGIKTVIHFHFGRISELYSKRNWEQKLLHNVIKLADKAIVIDKISYDTLIKEGYTNVELLPNPLSPKVNEIIFNHQELVKEDRKIVFVGHVVPTKGVFELVEVCKSIPDIKLKIIGYVSDDMKLKLIQLVGEKRDWLEIMGKQSFETTIKEMLSAGIFALPTYTEGSPNVIIESMACACPIIASAVGAIPEMLDIEGENNCGICTKPKSVEHLKIEINKMLEDRNFAISCGKNAQKRVNEQYSMSSIWKKLENIWQSSLN